jgi:hypothetical protein
VITFDDLSNPNRVLTGQYGSIDWGNGSWWLSGPYAQLGSNSVSFNGTSLRSATVSLPTPLRLVQLDVDNGGSSASTISLSCPGQPTVQATLQPGEIMTLRTNWTGTCTSITLSSTNGWDVNFDNIVVSGTGTTSPTSTPTPTPTATPTATPRTVTFDDLNNPNRPLNGQYPSGLIDWGTNVWYLSGPYGSFNTQSISFNGVGPTSAVFTLSSPSVILSVDVLNGGSTGSTVTLTCAGQPVATVRLTPNQLATLRTGWTTPCTSVTVASSNGWFTNFDNLVLR